LDRTGRTIFRAKSLEPFNEPAEQAAATAGSLKTFAQRALGKTSPQNKKLMVCVTENTHKIGQTRESPKKFPPA
jgi:hypothetical protein